MAGERVSKEMAGKTIRDIFKRAEQVADLHGCLTSHRGENFRFRLLQALERPMDESGIERFRIESGINEYHRHLNRLVKFGLVRGEETNGTRRYTRTSQGENAVDALRRFERRAGRDTALTVYAASLGPNSIRLFLRIYGDQREVDWNSLQITYTPAEIGRLSVF